MITATALRRACLGAAAELVALRALGGDGRAWVRWSGGEFQHRSQATVALPGQFEHHLVSRAALAAGAIEHGARFNADDPLMATVVRLLSCRWPEVLRESAHIMQRWRAGYRRCGS